MKISLMANFAKLDANHAAKDDLVRFWIAHKKREI